MRINDVIDKAAKKLMEFNLSCGYEISGIKDQMLWVPYTLPKMVQSEQHLFFACTTVTYLFYLDDVKEKYPEFNESAMTIHKKRQCVNDGSFDHDIYGVVYYYEQLLQQTLNACNYALFHRDLLAYIPSEDARNKRLRFNNLEQYLSLRVINVAIRPFLITLYDALNLNYPLAHDEHFIKAVCSISIMNDLHSYAKEIAEKEPYNALSILEEQQQDKPGNIAALLGQVHGYLADTFGVRDQLMREILVAAQLGSTAWHVMCNRYRVLYRLIATDP